MVACLTAVLAVSPGATSASSSTLTRRASPLEAAIVREVNAVRTARGLPTLSRSTGLTRAADTHTMAMFDSGKFDHELPGFPTFNQRMRRFYAGAAAAWSSGENLALFSGAAPTARDVVALWLDSPPHRAIMLDRTWRELGVAARSSAEPTGELAGQPTWLITLDVGRRTS